jgi:hypothetical protein
MCCVEKYDERWYCRRGHHGWTKNPVCCWTCERDLRDLMDQIYGKLRELRQQYNRLFQLYAAPRRNTRYPVIRQKPER